MMDEEELNNDLKRRITEVFDNYEDTTADEGWALLRQKYPPKEKDRGLAWLWYAAAAIVLMCLGLWFINKPEKTDQLMVKQPKKQIVHPQAPVNQQPANANLNTLKNNTANTIAQAGISVTKHAAQGSTVVTNPAPGANLQAVNKLHNPPATDQPIKKDSVDNNAANTGLAKNNPTDTQSDKPDKVNKTIDTGTVKPKEQFAGMQPSKAANEKAFNSLFASKDPDQKKSEKEAKANRKPNFSVYAATYFNYANGSDNQLNLGAGFSSDFRITNKLKLSTGVAIGQNSLSYNKAPVQSGDAFASSSVAAFTLKAVTSLNTPKPVDVSKRYNASLIGLDIPINLKYQFNPQKSDTYVSAGLSSGTFINETYQYVYANSQNAIESSTHNSFNSFDFARTLNVSFGVGYPLGKSNHLIVEPFLQYPLEGLGAQQIRFGAGGVNLKLNFQSSKK